MSSSSSYVQVQWISSGVVKKCKLQAGIENIDYSDISDDIKAKYSVIDDYFDASSFGLEKWECKNVEIAVS